MPPTQFANRGMLGITWDEVIDSGGGEMNYNAPAFAKKYLMMGCPNETSAVAQVETQLALGLNILAVNGINLFIYSYKVDPIPEGTGNEWLATLNYRFTVDYYEMSFDIGGATTKLLKAIDEGTYYDCVYGGEVTPGGLNNAPAPIIPGGMPGPFAGNVPDFKGLVGISGRSINGVDIALQKWDFTILVRQKLGTLPTEFLDTLYDLSGFINQDLLLLNWQGNVFTFYPGELLFYGCPGKQTSEYDLELTLKFGVQRNGTTQVADSGPIEKRGWDYLWVYSKEVPLPGAGGGAMVPQPLYAIINQVYQEGDFSQLGIFE